MSVQPIDGEAIAASLADPRAFGVIFERHFGVIHGYLRRRTTYVDGAAPAYPVRRRRVVEEVDDPAAPPPPSY